MNATGVYYFFFQHAAKVLKAEIVPSLIPQVTKLFNENSPTPTIRNQKRP